MGKNGYVLFYKIIIQFNYLIIFLYKIGDFDYLIILIWYDMIIIMLIDDCFNFLAFRDTSFLKIMILVRVVLTVTLHR